MTLPIYFGTILIEPNRWQPGKVPSIQVSDWLPRIREAGFDGIELWENHGLQASDEELDRLAGCELPIIYGTYDSCEDDTQDRRHQITEVIQRLGARGMKYNLGGDPERWEEYVRNAAAWAAELGPEFRMLCECHGGTVVSDAERAVRAFAEMEQIMNAERCGGPGMEAILHICSEQETVRKRVEVFGDRLGHIHVQKIEGSAAGPGLRLDRRPEEIRARLRVLREAGFNGTFTLEFTEGVLKTQSPGDVEMLFENALADLCFLRDELEKW